MLLREYPLVSIIIPVFNGSKYMREAIHSALAQTYPNVEILVINDGSTDAGATERIALSYGDRIRYFSKENGGVSTALNMGIKQMKGEYFSWLSHDDVYKPEKIQRQMELLETFPRDTILYGGYELINEKCERIGSVDPGALYNREKLNTPLYPILRGLVNGCTLLIHKSHFIRVGIFNPQLKSTQDYDLWFRMFRHATVKFHPGQYVQSRVHSEQGTNTLPHHEDECSGLWNFMMDDLTEEEMLHMEGSVYAFRAETEKFLRLNTSYKQAIRHANSLLQIEMKSIENKLTRLKVTVIIPFYNRVELLLQSVQSVLQQTHQNFELILVDDGTVEDCAKVFDIVAKDSRITYFRQDHKGAAAARNLGIDKARGDYIAFLDSDDLFVENKLSLQLAYMVKNGLDFSHTSYRRITFAGKHGDVITSGERMSGDVFPGIISRCEIATPTVMIRRAIIEGKRFIDEYAIGEDVCLWIDLAYKHKLGGIKDVLTLVRVGDSSAAFDPSKQNLGLANILAHVLRNPSYRQYKEQISQLVYSLSISLNSLEATPVSEQEGLVNRSTEQSGYLQKPKSKLRRLFISLGYDGLRTTIRKILYKIRIKIRRRA